MKKVSKENLREELYNMKIGDLIQFEEVKNGSSVDVRSIKRVPLGWIWGSVFVPYNPLEKILIELRKL